jgi:membrane-associated phospholipid phosphatase
MTHCYTNLTAVSCLVFLILVGAGDLEAAGDFLILFFAAAVTISAIGAFFPAAGATIHYAPGRNILKYIPLTVGTWFVAPLHAVRGDATHSFDLARMPGLTAFPSFHTAMGIIVLYCSRNRVYLLGATALFVPLMIGAAIVFGGHYFVDVIAGIATAAVLIALLRLKKGDRREGFQPDLERARRRPFADDDVEPEILHRRTTAHDPMPRRAPLPPG